MRRLLFALLAKHIFAKMKFKTKSWDDFSTMYKDKQYLKLDFYDDSAMKNISQDREKNELDVETKKYTVASSQRPVNAVFSSSPSTTMSVHFHQKAAVACGKIYSP